MANGYSGRLRYVSLAGYKARRIANVLRNKRYPEVVGILRNLPHKGAKIIRKLVESVASNALYLDRNLDEESLRLTDIQISDGPHIKRIWRRGRGRADVLLKKQSHIYVTLKGGR